jgi:molybdopterin molybdotransferase
VTPSSWSRARAAAHAAVGPVAPRVLAVEAVAGSVLAVDALALADLPAADSSAMDGWAVAGDPPWRIGPGAAGTTAGAVLAGDVPAARPAGTAVVIATGAAVPEGAGVLRREHGRRDGDLLVPTVPWDPAAGRVDIRPRAGECARGEVVLPAGTVLTPAGVGLLAAAGLDRVAVRRPAVDVLVLGDELVTAGVPGDGRVRDALGPLLAAWLGVAAGSRESVADTRDDLEAALDAARGDIVVTTGSTARGPVDHLHTVLADRGARLVVDGVDVRPGHPMLLALLADGRPLVGLPGNPLAAFSGMLTLLEPVLAALRGLGLPPTQRLTLGADVSAGETATRLVPVDLEGRPVLFAGPAMLRGLAGADRMAVVPPGGARSGDDVEGLSLRPAAC